MWSERRAKGEDPLPENVAHWTCVNKTLNTMKLNRYFVR